MLGIHFIISFKMHARLAQQVQLGAGGVNLAPFGLALC